MSVFSKENVIAALERAVALKGADYVYDAGNASTGECAYTTPDGKPSCIVGYVIADLQPELLPVFGAAERWESETNEDSGETEFYPADVFAISSAANYVPEWKPEDGVVSILLTAQTRQDAGQSWGDALEAAKKVAKALGLDDDRIK